MFWVLLSVVALLLIFLELRFRWRFRSVLKLPGAFEFPFIGSVAQHFTDAKSINNDFLKLIKKYGPIVRYSGLHEMYIVIADPEMIEFVLRSPATMQKGNLYNYMRRWLGDGLLLSTGQRYYHVRKHELPVFSHLQETVAEFDSHINVLVDVLSKNSENDQPVDIYPLIVCFALDVVTELVNGESMNMQRNMNKDYYNAMDFITYLIMRRTLSPWAHYEFFYKFSPLYKEEIKHVKVLDGASLAAIENRKKVLASTETKSIEKKRKLAIDYFNKLHEQNIISKDHIKTELNGAIWVAHDSTAATIAIMMYHLANNKDIQDKIVEELKLIFEDDRDRPATPKDLTEMKYTELVIKEILRYYGIIPFISRTASTDVEYKGIKIPKGTQLVLSIHGVHRSNHFENPEEFNPERFLPGNPITPYSYVPFSGGPRSCLGQIYSMYKTKTTFAKLLRHFEFETAGPEQKLELCSKLVMKPENGIYVKIKPRNF